MQSSTIVRNGEDKLSWIGQSVLRSDGRAKTTGRTAYTVNLELPGMLHVKTLRSPFPHARLLRVDTGRAARVPGVAALLTRDDLEKLCPGGATYGPVVRDQPIVAVDKVRFAGEIVAAVAAESLDAAEEALDLIEVEYEELPAVFDPIEALKEDAPAVHAAPGSATGAFTDTASLKLGQGSNLCSQFVIRKGDLEAGFEKSDYLFEHEFYSPAVQHCALEPHACVAQVLPDDSLELWATTQNPSVLRSQLQLLFGLPLSKIRVHVPPLGAGYGAKSWPKIEPLTAALAIKTGRPVKYVLSREEVFHTITKHAALVRLKTGVSREGLLLARKVEIFWDTGAYAEVGPRVSKNGGYAAPGPYRIPNVWVDSYCVYTNKPPAGAFRGYGVSQVCWAYDQQMDIIAEALGMDPLELRLKNAFEEEDSFHTGQTLHGIGIKESLLQAADSIGWTAGSRSTALGSGGRIRRGRGIACSIKGTVTPSLSTAVVKLEEDGSVSVLTSTVEMGQGSDTALAQMAAEALHVDFSRVKVASPDTLVTPYDQSTTSSRSTYSMGNAILMACAEVKQQLLEAAADLLEVSMQDLDLADGRVFVKGSPDRSMSYEEVVTRHFGMRVGSIIGRGTFKTSGRGLDPETGQGYASAFWSTGAAAAEVEVDTETGEVRILKFTSACDVGKAINPLHCVGQVEGSVVMSLGHTFYEEIVYDSGQLINPNFLDYRLPSVCELPDSLNVILIEKPHREGPFGAHGVGETASPPVSSAIANAIYDATGVRITELPITPEKILLGLRQLQDKRDQAAS